MSLYVFAHATFLFSPFLFPSPSPDPIRSRGASMGYSPPPHPHPILTFFSILPRDAILALYMLSSCVCLSVCLCVCYVRYCTETAKPSVTQTTPHNSPCTLGFCGETSMQISNGVMPNSGAKCRWGRLKLARQITRYNSQTVQDIDA